MHKQHFTTLLEKYLSGTATLSERRLLDEYFHLLQVEDADGLQELLENHHLRREMFSTILSRTTTAPASGSPVVSMQSRWKWVAGIAAALLFAVAGIRILTLSKRAPVKQEGLVQLALKKAELRPGTDKAVLTLSNGRQVTLDSSAIRDLKDQGSDVSLVNNKILYSSRTEPVAENSFNTLSTPRGGQYQLVLADGTRVWLNAASTIRYPLAFNGDKRTVELKGEAYFEVAENHAKPFFVKTNGMEVAVLGTHFDVMAYDDEPRATATLLEGSVKLQSGAESGLLKPGQQGAFNAEAGGLHISTCDTNKVVAWKQGLFRFKGDDIQTIMRQLQRWYDVDVTYQGAIPERKYSGTISKYVDAGEVFKILNLAGINFKQNGKTITVTQSPI